MKYEMQNIIFSDLLTRLGTLPEWGQLVEEDNVLRVIDSDDSTLPDSFIIVQPGITEEIERAGQGSVRERWTLNITPITRNRNAGPALRNVRVLIKRLLTGQQGGFGIPGLQAVVFMPETPMLAGPGQRWSAHVMPLQITYVQPLK